MPSAPKIPLILQLYIKQIHAIQMKINKQVVKHIVVISAVIATTFGAILFNYRHIALIKYIPKNASIVVKLDLFSIAKKSNFQETKLQSPLMELLFDNEFGQLLKNPKNSGISMYFPIYGALYKDTSLKNSNVQNLVIICKLADAEIFKTFVEKTHKSILNLDQTAILKNKIFRYNTAGYSIIWDNKIATINVFNANNANTYVYREDMWLGLNILKNNNQQTNHKIIEFNHQKQDIGILINSAELLNFPNRTMGISNWLTKDSQFSNIATSIGIQFNTGYIHLNMKNYLSHANALKLDFLKTPSTAFLNTLPNNAIALSSHSLNFEKIIHFLLQFKPELQKQVKKEFQDFSGDIGIALTKIQAKQETISQYNEDIELDEYSQSIPSNHPEFDFEVQIILGKKHMNAKNKYLLSLLELLYNKVQITENRIAFTPKFGGNNLFYLHTLKHAWVFSNSSNIDKQQNGATKQNYPVFGYINCQHPDIIKLKKSYSNTANLIEVTNWINQIQWKGEHQEAQLDIQLMDSNKNALAYLLENSFQLYQANKTSFIQ